LPNGWVSHANLTWHTALSCNGGSCIKVAASGDIVLIADSKEPDGPVLAYTPAEWREFLAGAKNGDFDDLLR
jgi:predicted secreted Zn-dependent protease